MNEYIKADDCTHHPALVHARRSDIAVVVGVDIDDSLTHSLTHSQHALQFSRDSAFQQGH